MTAELAASYLACRRIAARHGRTYFLATRLLPPARRPAVHALYALARMADDIVDGPGAADDVCRTAARLDAFAAGFLAGWGTPGAGVRDSGADASGSSGGILPAVRDTVDRYGIRRELFEAFFASMRMDLARDSYSDFAALSRYTYGSAEVIGLQLLPVLGVVPGAEPEAGAAARALGLAFQLTNFVRDVGEDLDRGRLYLPLADLAAAGLTRADLERRVVDGRVRELLHGQIRRIRAIYQEAEPGIALLHPASRDCVRTAFVLYAEILDAVEMAGYRVLDRRVSVGTRRRLAVFGPALRRARRARRSHHTHQASVWTTMEKPKSRSSTGA
jgi:phytoene synthase